jgi:hypothetical protein
VYRELKAARRDAASAISSGGAAGGRRAVNDRKWEWWSNGMKRSRTICVRLWPDSAELSIAGRGIDSSGHMTEINTFICNAEHLPKLIYALNRALAVATERGLIKQPRK